MSSYSKQYAEMKRIFFANTEFAGFSVRTEWERLYAHLDADPMVHLACTIYRRRAASFDRLKKALHNYKISGDAPFCVASDDPSMIYVYPNLPNANFTKGTLNWMSIFTDEEFGVLTKIHETFEAGRKTEKPPFTSKELCSKFLRRRKKIKVTKFLQEYIPSFKDAKAHTIRDHAEKVSNILRPLVLHVAKTHDDIVKFYEGGASGSCMTLTSDYAKHWKVLFKKDKIHPGEYYLYDPNTHAVWIEVNNTVIARCVVTTVITGKRKGNVYSKVYSQSTEARNQLIELINEKFPGAQSVSSASMALQEDFTVKGIWSDYAKDYLIPVPYVDTYAGKAYITFDIESKTFIVSNKLPTTPHYVVTDWKKWQGYFFAKDLFKNNKCALCNKATSGEASVVTTDNFNFCTSEHAKLSGYIAVRTSDGVLQFMPKNSDYIRITGTDRDGFTNLHAAEVYGYHVMLSSAVEKTVDMKTVSSEMIIEFDPKTLNIDQTLPEIKALKGKPLKVSVHRKVVEYAMHGGNIPSGLRIISEDGRYRGLFIDVPLERTAVLIDW